MLWGTREITFHAWPDQDNGPFREPACSRRQAFWFISEWTSIMISLWEGSVVSNFCSGLGLAHGTNSSHVTKQSLLHILRSASCISSNNLCLIERAFIIFLSSMNFCHITQVVCYSVYLFSSYAQYQFRNKIKFSFIQFF